MTDDAVTAGGVPIEGNAASPARLTDEMTAELTGPERTPPKGPDPAEWGEEQLIAPPDVAATEAGGDYEVKGPDPAKWGTDEERDAAERARVDEHVQAAAEAGTTRTDPGPDAPETVTIGSGDVADAGTVLGVVAPQSDTVQGAVDPPA